MKKLFAPLALVLALLAGTYAFSVSNIVQSITYSPQVKGFIALIKGDSSRVIEEKPKQYEAGKTYNGVALTVTGSNWTTTRGVFVPYRTYDGAWRMRFNMYGTTSVAAASLALTTSGVTFSASMARQAVSGVQNSGSASIKQAYTVASSGTTTIEATGAEIAFGLSGDVELASKPTWAD